MTSLNQNEMEALRILWERGELKPAEIQAHFSWPIENATLRSVLVNLVEKKHIARRLQGKAFFYAARVPKATLLQSTLVPVEALEENTRLYSPLSPIITRLSMGDSRVFWVPLYLKTH